MTTASEVTTHGNLYTVYIIIIINNNFSLN